ncbi:MAG TPA: tyrosine--tRNA ligase [Acidimicrobiales bacterium]|nr:tyrosine--tRNA ligase [Acidimicrobiales bacterium]
MTDVVEELTWRGLVHQMTDAGLAGRLAAEPVTVYAGFDPTAPSLHVGHLIPLLNLRRFQLAGHRPVALVGGGTGMIGDPSGRSSERALLSDDEVSANVESIREQLGRILDFDAGGGSAVLADNRQWLAPVGLIDFLRDVGKHFTVNQMIAKESVRSRLEDRDQGLSFTEFSYMLLQSYDFLHLYDAYGCRLQLGGSDQWGNITTGIDLIRRLRGAEAFGLTTPLLLRPDGTKYGKSESGAVWLDARLTSPYALWQFMRRSEDALVGTLLRWFTFLPRERIEELEGATVSDPGGQEAQRVLAHEVTALVHGEAEADKAQRAAAVLFSADVASLDEQTLLDVFADAPSSKRAATDLDPPGLPVVEAMRDCGLCRSLTEARTAVTQGGVYVNNARVQDPEASITGGDLIAGRYVVLRRGRKNHHLVSFG